MCLADFVKTLPEQTECVYCHRPIRKLNWGVGPFGASAFMGVCIVKCEYCHWGKIAAAGSTTEAHQEAQKMRARLIEMTGL